MELVSPEFGDGEEMPEKVGLQEDNVNPELRFHGVPEKAKSLILVMDDPDAKEPAGKIWDHWILYDINPSTEKIEEGETAGTPGRTDFRENRYGGPNPPDGEHIYRFRLYALDTELGLEPGKTKSEVMEAARGHIIERSELHGRYE